MCHLASIATWPCPCVSVSLYGILLCVSVSGTEHKREPWEWCTPGIFDPSYSNPLNKIEDTAFILSFFLVIAIPVAYGSPKLGVKSELQLQAYTTAEPCL